MGTIDGNCRVLPTDVIDPTELDEPAHPQPAAVGEITIGGVTAVGAIVSTMKVLLVGVGSVLPARSIERIETVWVASERPVYVLGELHRE